MQKKFCQKLLRDLLEKSQEELRKETFLKNFREHLQRPREKRLQELR